MVIPSISNRTPYRLLGGRIGSGMKKSVPSRRPKEVGFSQGPSRPEKTTCDGRRSSNAEDLNQLLLMLAVIGGILPPNFQPWRANGRSCSIYPEA